MKTKWVLLSILLFLALSPSLALAAGTGGGGGLPWETPLQNVQQSLTGPVAKGVALVAIVGAIGTMLFLHAEMNAFTRVVVFVVMGIGTLIGANAFLTGSGAQGAEVTGTPKTSERKEESKERTPQLYSYITVSGRCLGVRTNNIIPYQPQETVI